MNENHKPLGPDLLRWKFDESQFDFKTTAEVEPIKGIVGQDAAVASLEFGLATTAPGQNIYVRGLDGTGRMALIKRLLDENHPICRRQFDRCYVTDFERLDRPRLITLDAGQGAKFRKKVHKLADFIRDDLAAALDSDAIAAKRKKMAVDFQKQLADLVKPFEDALAQAEMKLVQLQAGNSTKTSIFPIHGNAPVAPEEFEKLRREGRISEKRYNDYMDNRERFSTEFEEISLRVQELQAAQSDALFELMASESRRILERMAKSIRKEFKEASQFLDQLIADVVENKLGRMSELEHDFTDAYRVNLISSRCPDQECPIVVENTPTVSRLLGNIDSIYDPQQGGARTDHTMIKAGSILRADGGYLILDARDVLEEPGAWKVLVRSLRTGKLEIVPHDWNMPFQGLTLKPEPINIDVKVILIGDADIYYALEQVARDFTNLFKVLVDFDSHIPRSTESARQYASVLSRMVHEESLIHFSSDAVARLVEHGARIASRGGKISARFGRLADIARESSFLAQQQEEQIVTGQHVIETVIRTKRRADLPSRRFAELIQQGIIKINTSGTAVGQINGLAVMNAGPLTYGFPARITATIGPGTAGVINIEREAALSGAIHTKGFYILNGLMRYLLRTPHPLTFEASIAFEQSYGGIDGDSASGAEICCLLSALTDLPIRQDLAMTGAIDQTGNILAIGAVNEKIEGFFDICRANGLTGSQGAIIPQSNAGDLMLRRDVVQAAEQGQFHIYSVSSILEALELFMGMAAGSSGEPGEHTVLGVAIKRAREYWIRAHQTNGGAENTS